MLAVAVYSPILPCLQFGWYLLWIITSNNSINHTYCRLLPHTTECIIPHVNHYQQQQHGSYLLYIITSTSSMNHTSLCIITSNNRIDHTSCGSLPAATEWIIPLVDHYQQQQNGSYFLWIFTSNNRIDHHQQHQHGSYLSYIITNKSMNHTSCGSPSNNGMDHTSLHHYQQQQHQSYPMWIITSNNRKILLVEVLYSVSPIKCFHLKFS
jgi:hypothetical protein